MDNHVQPWPDELYLSGSQYVCVPKCYYSNTIIETGTVTTAMTYLVKSTQDSVWLMVARFPPLVNHTLQPISHSLIGTTRGILHSRMYP